MEPSANTNRTDNAQNPPDMGESTQDGRAQIAVLLEGCERAVFLFAMSLLHNAADAEEIVQQTRVVAWEKFDCYRPGTDFLRWACAIARFQALKFRERRSREARLFSDGFIERMADESEKSLPILEARREALRRCLRKLSRTDRDLVLRRYRSGATTRSIAEAMGRSVQGTRKTLHRIRNVLSACVQRTLAAEGDE